MANKGKVRTLLVKDSNGEFKVEIPEDAKITFGPNVPYAHKNGNYSMQQGYALRIYKGTKENILAVFCNVLWFRDVDMPVYKLKDAEAKEQFVDDEF